MEFEKAVPKRVRDVLLPRVRGWIGTPAQGSLRELLGKLPEFVNLSEGDVGFVTPVHIREAAKKAIDEGRTQYTYLRELREAIAEKLLRDNKIEADPDEEIIVSSGCHSILAQVFAAFIDTGDEVIMASPDLYFYVNSSAWGGSPVFVPLSEQHGFHLDPEEVEAAITTRTKIIAITTPDGPVGAVHRQTDLERIAELALKHDLLVISDEIYEKINFGRYPHFSIASLPGMRARTITVNGLSKGYAMTGWRVGYGVIPRQLLRAVQATNSLNTIRLDSIAQYASVAALRGPQEAVEQNVEEYRRKMRILVDGINSIDGLHCSFPEGTYYLWVNISELGSSADHVARHCLISERVFVSPGTTFFGPGCEQFVRASCSAPEEELREGLRRLGRAVEKLREGQLLLTLETLGSDSGLCWDSSESNRRRD